MSECQGPKTHQKHIEGLKKSHFIDWEAKTSPKFTETSPEFTKVHQSSPTLVKIH